MKTKAELLAHYAEAEPKEFIQFDGFDFPKSALDEYYLVKTDENGDSVMVSETTELFTAVWDIRVLIPAGTSKETAIRMLKRIQANIESGGLLPELKESFKGLHGYVDRLREHMDRRKKLRIVGQESESEDKEIPF